MVSPSRAAAAETKQKNPPFGSQLLSAVFITAELESSARQRVIWVSFQYLPRIISGPGDRLHLCDSFHIIK